MVANKPAEECEHDAAGSTVVVLISVYFIILLSTFLISDI